MKKGLVAMIILALVAVLVAGCEGAPLPTPAPTQEPAPAPMPTPTVEKGNFRLLISDEVNAIDHFASLNVTISSVGLQQRGKPGGWITHELDPKKTVDLKDLVGDNATEIWSGYVDPGEYIKVFIHVDNVTGILDGAYGGGTANVTLPSDKLQISKPFTLSPDLLVNFVFDITVVQAGKSGKYILKPQIDPSGPGKPFNLVTAKGKPVKLGEVEEELELQLEGEPGLGMEVTLIVTDNESAAVGANVTVNGEDAGITDANGRLPIVLPDTPGEVEIEATLGDKRGELEVELEEEE